MKQANICGENIKKQRQEINMKQVDLSAALSVDHGIEIDQSDISEIERGVRGVKDFELRAICEVLGVNCDEVLK